MKTIKIYFIYMSKSYIYFSVSLSLSFLSFSLFFSFLYKPHKIIRNPKHCGGKGGCLGSVPELAFDWVKANGLASEAGELFVKLCFG